MPKGKKGTGKGKGKATAKAATDERKICPTCGRPIPKHRLTPDQIRAKLESLRERREKAAAKLERQQKREAKLAEMLGKIPAPDSTPTE